MKVIQQQRGGSIHIAALLKNVLDHPRMILPEWRQTLFWEITRVHEAVSGPVCLGNGSKAAGTRAAQGGSQYLCGEVILDTCPTGP